MKAQPATQSSSKEVKTPCPYCGVGCGIIASKDSAGQVTVKGDPQHPANFGRLCSKGSALAETIDLEGRLLFPEISGNRASWDDALTLVSDRFRQTIAEHGPDSVAFYVSGQCLTEDYYVANKLMKGFIGSANIDTNSRLCMASSVAGHKRAFGSDTVPGTYADFEQADLMILVGSNLAWCHPVIYQRIVAAKTARPNMKIVLIDPRRTMTADIVDMHLAIRPDGDVALFNGLLAHIARTGAIKWNFIQNHTNGFSESLSTAQELTLNDLEVATGLPAAQLLAFYRLFEKTEKVVTAFSQGVNQSSCGTDKVNAIINCHLATNRIGRPGMGPFSLTGQPNAMGGREVGGLANMLAAHMEISDPDARDRVRRFWNAPLIAQRPGLKAVDMFKAVADGRIKAIWIMSTNPVVSMPDADAVRDALKVCPFVVVSDIMRTTDTTVLAHVLLPALGWGEKDGTVTNSERRISRQRAFLPAPGEARADWWQMAEVARRMGFAEAFAYQNAGDIFTEHAALSSFENNQTRDFDIGAYADLDADQFNALPPFQWPQAKGETRKDTRFFADGAFYTPDKKARFIAIPVPIPASNAEEYPLVLNTGRIRDHWHTMTRTGKTARLSAHYAEPFAEIHPQDADPLGITDASLVTLTSPHGSIIVRALLTHRQQVGSVFVPMHWTGQYASCARVDTLASSVTDPVSGQPALKNVGVHMKPTPVKAYGFAVMAKRPALGPAINTADYWALAKADSGWRMELGFTSPPGDWSAWARQVFGLDDPADPIGYADSTTGQYRLAFFAGDRLVASLFIAPDPVGLSRSHTIRQLGQSHGDQRKRYGVIAGRPGADQTDAGATVCACFSVGINQITAAVANGCTSVAAIGEHLKAGTNCGSCRSEIRGIIDGCTVAAAE
jgi:assimilatory nitrate reductase catalytic subunit